MEEVALGVGGVVFVIILAIAIISFIAIIWAIIDILRNPRLSTGERILWIVIVLVLEIIGVILYALLGRK